MVPLAADASLARRLTSAVEGLGPAVLESKAQGAQQRQHRDGETLFGEGDIAHPWLLMKESA